MLEHTDTSKFQMIPAGHYNFTVEGKPEKIKTAKSSYRKWVLQANDGQTVKKIIINFYPWESKEILLVLGAKDEKGVMVWDDETVDGLNFNADLTHGTYDLNGETRSKYILSNFKEGIPF